MVDTPQDRQGGVTVRSFFATHAAVLLAVAMAAGTGAIAWGQTSEKVDKLEARADQLDGKLEQLRMGQEKSGRVLERLDERSTQQERMQQQILRSIEDIGQRLNERDVRRYGTP